jgi:hypothetical protein
MNIVIIQKPACLCCVLVLQQAKEINPEFKTRCHIGLVIYVPGNMFIPWFGDKHPAYMQFIFAAECPVFKKTFTDKIDIKTAVIFRFRQGTKIAMASKVIDAIKIGPV